MARQRLLVLGVVLVVLIQAVAQARETGQDTTFTLPGGAMMEMVWIEPGMFTMGSPDSDNMASE